MRKLHFQPALYGTAGAMIVLAVMVAYQQVHKYLVAKHTSALIVADHCVTSATDAAVENEVQSDKIFFAGCAGFF